MDIKKISADILSGLFNLEGRVGKSMVIRKWVTSLFILWRSKLPLTQIEKLSKEIPFHIYLISTSELHKSNDWYGTASWLKKYAHIPQTVSLKVTIEHGFYPSNEIFHKDIKSDLPIMVTMAKKRAAYLSLKAKKKSISIGPYIHYAQDFLSPRDYQMEKERLGKNLLVFPYHSTGISKVNYDKKKLCKKIHEIGKGFDSIRICMYWKDVKHGHAEYFKKQGFECVTAGYMLDPNFLPRLKSIIKLSDFTVSQGVGTQVGYCILLHKPHYIMDDRHFYTGTDKDELKLIRKGKNCSNYKKIETAFNHIGKNISQYQYDIVNYYWGLDQIKSSIQLRKILESPR